MKMPVIVFHFKYPAKSFFEIFYTQFLKPGFGSAGEFQFFFFAT